MKLEIKKMGINGEGIAYDHKKPVFIPGCFPGEVVEVDQIQKHGSYGKAEVSYITQKADFRRKSPAPTEEKLGHPFYAIDYAKQGEFKLDLLKEALWKYAHVKSQWIRKINLAPNEFSYRNQCKLPIQDRNGELVCGLFKPNSNHFQVVHNFLSHDPQLEKIRKKVLFILNQNHYPAYDAQKKKGLRYLILRSIEGKTQVTLVTGTESLDSTLIQKLQSIEGLTSLYQSQNAQKQGTNFFGKKTKLLFGEDGLTIPFSSIQLHLSPEAFFQLNTKQAKSLYEYAISKVDPCETLVEAYCGIGAMSLLASSKANHVIGIELNPQAIEDAKKNATLNQIENVEFQCKDACDGLYQIAKKQSIDCLLVDPPRSGLDDAMLEAMLKIPMERIIYISCNPATLAKNLFVLKQVYEVTTIQAFDLFPQTPHVESVVLLTRKRRKS